MVKHSARHTAKMMSIVLLAVLAFVSQSLVMAQTPTATATAAATGEVEIVGRVTAINNQSIMIGGQTFDINTAEIKANVAVSALVKIHATQVTTGQWVAREVELARPTASQTATPQSPQTTPDPKSVDEFEITGQITDFNDTTIVIAGQVIDISNAEIKDTLTANGLVKVHVSIVDGVWVAREVELASNPVNSAGTPVATLQGNDGRNGQDDGPNHDLNDDHGGNNGNSGSGSDDNGSNNDNNGNDDHNNNGGNNGNSGSGNGGEDDGSGGHGGGGDNSGGGHDHG